MQFMMMLKMREDLPQPPDGFMAAMGEYIGQAMQKGNIVGMGGLLPSAQGAQVRAEGGKVVTTHGPFTETTELIGGYAILEYDTLEQAIEGATEFVQLHMDAWPGWEGTSEVRPIAG